MLLIGFDIHLTLPFKQFKMEKIQIRPSEKSNLIDSPELEIKGFKYVQNQLITFCQLNNFVRCFWISL